MPPSHLALVPPPTNDTSCGSQLKELQNQIRTLAMIETAAFHTSLMQLHQQAEEILAAGDAFPVGVREVARGVAEETLRQAKTLQVLSGRTYPLNTL